MEELYNFLLINGFERESEFFFKNKKCSIEIDNDLEHYIVTMFEKDGVMYSHNLEIYWLVGVLTWFDLMPRNYII